MRFLIHLFFFFFKISVEVNTSYAGMIDRTFRFVNVFLTGRIIDDKSPLEFRKNV